MTSSQWPTYVWILSILKKKNLHLKTELKMFLLECLKRLLPIEFHPLGKYLLSAAVPGSVLGPGDAVVTRQTENLVLVR